MKQHFFIFYITLIFFSTQIFSQNIISGPVTGAVTSGSAKIVFQTRKPDVLTLTLINTATGAEKIFSEKTLPENFGFHTFQLSGLSPFTRYDFTTTSQLEPDELLTGSFTTFPEIGQKGVYTFVTGSCQETENMKVFDVMPLHQPLFMMHTGDFTYPDYQIAPDYSADYSKVALSYTKRYNEKRMKEMLQTVPIDYVFDDNDHVGGSSGRYCKNHFYSEKKGPLRYDNFFQQDTFPEFWRQNVVRGYVEFFPHYELPDTQEAIHHSFTLGNAEFFVLDRNSSRPYPIGYAFEQNKRGRWRFNPPEDHCMFCDIQMNWLKESLKNSTADWKFIVSGVPLNKNLQKLIDTGLFLQRFKAKGYSGFHMAYGFGSYGPGYQHELNDFHDFIKNENIKNVIVISGDTHHNVMDDGKNAGLPELNASGLSVTGTELAWYMQLIGRLTGRYNLRKHVWNQGGNGIGNKNFKNAFGKVTIVNDEYVELSIIDEDNEVVSSFKVFSESLKNEKKRR